MPRSDVGKQAENHSHIVQQILGLYSWLLAQGFVPGGGGVTVENIAALKALTSSSGNVDVQGYYTAGDGGGGRFVWYDEDPTADNGGTIIAPTSELNGRWRRDVPYDAQIPARWFGVKADGTTDDSDALNAAIDSLSSGTIVLPKGIIGVGSSIEIHRGIRLLGIGTFDNASNSVIKLLDASDCPIIQTPSAWDTTPGDHATHYMALENLCIEGNSAGQTAENDGVQWWGSYIGSYLRNVFINDVYGCGLNIDWQSDLQLDHVWVNGCVTASGYAVDTNQSCRGTALRYGLLNIDHFYVENTSNKKGGDPRNVPADRGKGVRLFKALSVNINEIHIEGVTSGIDIEDSSVIRINNITGTWIGYDMLMDNCALILYLDALTKKISVSSGYLFNQESNCYMIKKAFGVTSDYHPDRAIIGGFNYLCQYTAQSDPAGGEDIQSPTAFTNAVYVRRIGSAGAILTKWDWDPTTEEYAQVSTDGTTLEIGASLNQPSENYKWFWRVNSYGNAGDSVSLNTPIYFEGTRSAPDNILNGSMYRWYGSGVDGPAWQLATGTWAGTRFFALCNWKDTDPSQGAISIGEEWINYNTGSIWKANAVGGTAANFVRLCQYDDARLSDERVPTSAGLASKINGATAKTPLVDADEFPLADSAATYGLKKTLWSSIKSTLKTYFDAIYGAIANVHVKHGFENQTDATRTFTDGTLTFALSGTFSYWFDGTKVTKTTTQSKAISNTIGMHFLYFDSSGVLQETMTPFEITDRTKVIAGIVYWNGSEGAPQEERHGCNRNLDIHASLHFTRNTAYQSGLDGTFTNTTLSITQGIIWDEDIKFDTGGTKTNCRVWYYSAAASKMTFANVTTPYATTGGNLAYDASGTLTAVDSGKHVVNDVYAALDDDRPIYVRAGTSQYATLADARAAALATWNNAASYELKLLYRVIYKNNGGTINYVEKSDFRTAGSGPGGSSSIAPHASTHQSTGSDALLLTENYMLVGNASGKAAEASAATVASLLGVVSSSLNSGYFWVGNGSNVATAVQMSGDATMANTGAVTIANGAVTAVKTANITEGSITGTTTVAATDRGKSMVCTGTTSDYTVTLLPSGADFTTGDEIEFRMSSALTKLVTLDAGSGGLIDGVRLRTMWANETARIRYLGSQKWVKIAGHSIPMTCKLTANAVQTINTASFTTATMDSNRWDTGGIGDLANDRINIKRSGNYICGAACSWNAAHASTQILYMGSTSQYFLGNDSYVTPAVNAVELSAGDTVYLSLYQATGGNKDTYSTPYPTIWVNEINVW